MSIEQAITANIHITTKTNEAITLQIYASVLYKSMPLNIHSFIYIPTHEICIYLPNTINAKINWTKRTQRTQKYHMYGMHVKNLILCQETQDSRYLLQVHINTGNINNRAVLNMLLTFNFSLRFLDISRKKDNNKELSLSQGYHHNDMFLSI